MAHSSNDRENKKTLEIKQNFLASAISDISTYIQLTDSKELSQYKKYDGYF